MENFYIAFLWVSHKNRNGPNICTFDRYRIFQKSNARRYDQKVLVVKRRLCANNKSGTNKRRRYEVKTNVVRFVMITRKNEYRRTYVRKNLTLDVCVCVCVCRVCVVANDVRNVIIISFATIRETDSSRKRLGSNDIYCYYNTTVSLRCVRRRCELRQRQCTAVLSRFVLIVIICFTEIKTRCTTLFDCVDTQTYDCVFSYGQYREVVRFCVLRKSYFFYVSLSRTHRPLAVRYRSIRDILHGPTTLPIEPRAVLRMRFSFTPCPSSTVFTRVFSVHKSVHKR